MTEGGGGRSARLRFSSLREAVSTSLWFLPAVLVVLVIVLAVISLAIDRSDVRVPVVGFTGSPESARSVLSAIAGAIASLTALVFSVTVVVLQLASSQYSPRVLRTFLRDRRSQSVLGVFLATFTYAMITLRAVRGSTGDTGNVAYVPQLSVSLAFGFTLLSLALFVFYIHHIAQSMQASSVVAQVVDETRDAIDRLYPVAGEDAEVPPSHVEFAPPLRVLRAQGYSGYLQAVDEDALLQAACEHDVAIRLVPTVGDFVAEGTPLFETAGTLPDAAEAELRSNVTLGRRRTVQQDVAFGFRQLVDIAEKALSPGINDPTTAVQALDRLEQLLLLLATRQLPSPARADDAGVVRLVLPRPGWESYVRLAFDEIRQYGGGSIQVTRRLRAVAEEIAAAVPPHRRGAVEEQLRLLDRSAERSFDNREDVRHAKRTSGHG